MQASLFLHLRITFVLWFLFVDSHAQNNFRSWLNELEYGDTLYLNFCISSGEFARVHRGILLYKTNNEVFCKYVLYDHGISLLPKKLIKIDSKARVIPLRGDSILRFYDKIKTSYFVIRSDWELGADQLRYLNQYFADVATFRSEGHSNAPDYYTIIDRKKSLVVLDQGGGWNKFLEFEKVMNLD